MRRLYIMLLSAVLLQACGSLPFVGGLFPPTRTRAPSATATVTFTPTRTSIPTKTSTATASPTIVRFPTQDPNLPTATFIPIPIFVGSETATPLVLVAPSLSSPGAGFTSVTISTNKIFWGVCKNNKATVTAVVDDPDEVLSVIIFVRVKAAQKEDYTPWTTGDAMHDHGDGTYTYILRGSEIEGHNHYKNSWVFFQLVATNIEGREVGRTIIYREALALSPCM